MEPSDLIVVLIALLLTGFISARIAMEHSDRQLCKHVGGIYLEGQCFKDKEEVQP